MKDASPQGRNSRSMEETLAAASPEPTALWEQYSQPLRRAVFRAQERAAAAGVREIEPEHLLEGLLADDERIPAWVVRSLGVDLDPLQRGMAALAPGAARSSALRLSNPARRMLILARWEARQFGDPVIGTGHLLLALLDYPGPAADCLWNWRVVRPHLYEWLAERASEERMDSVPARWEAQAPPPDNANAPPPLATIRFIEPVSPGMALAQHGLPQWLAMRAFTGVLQCVAVLMICSSTVRLAERQWLFLWLAEGAWIAFTAVDCSRELPRRSRRAWAQTFAFMYVQCASLAVAVIAGRAYMVCALPLAFLLLSALAFTPMLFKAREAFGVEPREGWRTMLREGKWVLAAGVVFSIMGILAWPLASGNWDAWFRPFGR